MSTGNGDMVEPQQEVAMQSQQNLPRRNPIAKSFGAGINQTKVVPSKRRDRRVKHRNREIERDFE
jgi:hypothetical protein